MTRVCNHKYEYIATERVPTDEWSYGYRVYKEEVIVYCPLCHTHHRMNKEEWDNYNKIHKLIEDEEKGNLVHCFNKDKKCEFTCENSLFNLKPITDVTLTEQTIETDIYYKEK